MQNSGRGEVASAREVISTANVPYSSFGAIFNLKQLIKLSKMIDNHNFLITNNYFEKTENLIKDKRQYASLEAFQ